MLRADGRSVPALGQDLPGPFHEGGEGDDDHAVDVEEGEHHHEGVKCCGERGEHCVCGGGGVAYQNIKMSGKNRLAPIAHKKKRFQHWDPLSHTSPGSMDSMQTHYNQNWGHTGDVGDVGAVHLAEVRDEVVVRICWEGGGWHSRSPL